MSLVRWQPWQEMETLRRQLDQLFDDLAPISRTNFPIERKVWSPAIELKTTDADVILRAELPGIDAKDLDVQVAREAVVIAGEYRTETKTEENKVFRSEFRYGNFRRVVPLPVEVQNDKVQAEFKDGILTLTLPKVEADRHKVVKINLGGEAAPAIASGKGEAPVATQVSPATEQSQTEDVWAENSQS